MVVRVKPRGGDAEAAYLSTTEVDRVIATLAPYGSKAAAKIEVGNEYRVLPGSTFRTGSSSHTSILAQDGVTRVEVTGGPDIDGD